MSGLTPAQLAERREGITATDVPAILGLHPYRSAIDVWLEKMGEHVPSSGDRDVLEMGIELEAPVRRLYARREQRAVVPGATMTHAQHAHHKATPDGLSWPVEMDGFVLSYYALPLSRADRGLECKSHSVRARNEYGAPGTDEVPAHEIVQCAWGMHVTGLALWDLALVMDNRMSIYTIGRDLDFEAILVDAADRFWVDHVLAKKPPAPDGSRQYTEWLRRRFPGRGPAVQADEPTAAAIARLRDVRRLERQLTGQRAALEQAIQAAMGDAEAIEANGERLTWARCKDSERVDWEAVAKEIDAGVMLARSAIGAGGTAFDALSHLDAALASLDITRVAKHHTKTTPGARQFRVPSAWHKENE